MITARDADAATKLVTAEHSTLACLAHTNKSLAWINKSPDRVRATKRHQPEGDVGYCVSYVLPQP